MITKYTYLEDGSGSWREIVFMEQLPQAIFGREPAGIKLHL